MKRGTLAFWLVALLALGLVLVGCGTVEDDTPTPVPGVTGGGSTGGAGGTETAGTPAPTQPPAAPKSAKIGEPVSVKDYTVTVDSATLDSGSLKVSFTFDNTKGQSIVPLSGMAFAGFASVGGAPLDADLLCTTLPGRADAGKKVQGFVCWKAPGASAATGMQVQYDPGRFGNGVVTWILP